MKAIRIKQHPESVKALTKSSAEINHSSKIGLPVMDGYIFRPILQIIYLQAKGNYTLIQIKGGEQILVSKTLSAIEALINKPAQFVRVHRSHCINLDYLQQYIKGKGGYVVLEGAHEAPVSSGKRQNFLNALAAYFHI